MSPRYAVDLTMYRAGLAGMGNALLNLCEGLAEVATPGEVTVFVRRSEAATFARFASTLRIEPVRINSVLERLAWQNFVLPVRTARFDATCFPASYGPFLFPWRSVVIVADLQYLTYPQYWSWSRRLYRYLYTRRTLRQSTVVVAVSQFTAGQIERHFGVRARVIPNAIAIARPTAAPARTTREPYFLVPGSLLPHKNIAALLDALRGWPAGEEHPRLVFIGPFQASDVPPDLLTDRVEVRGFVSREERDALVNGCSAVVVPSVFEGFGMPYVEGMLAGKPVIASDIPPAREQLGDGGLYIAPPFDAPAVRAALRAAAHGALPPVEPAAVDALRARTSPPQVARLVLDALADASAGRGAARAREAVPSPLP